MVYITSRLSKTAHPDERAAFHGCSSIVCKVHCPNAKTLVLSVCLLHPPIASLQLMHEQKMARRDAYGTANDLLLARSIFDSVPTSSSHPLSLVPTSRTGRAIRDLKDLER